MSTPADNLPTMFAELIRVMTENQQARQQTPNVETPREPKAKEPETFDGKKEKLNEFLTSCHLVFRLQPSRFPNDEIKISYMISFLRGSPLLSIEPHFALPINQQPSYLTKFDEFIKFLKDRYGDPDEKGTARRHLANLTQSGSAAQFFAEFHKYTAILQYVDDSQLVETARSKLRSELKVEVARETSRSGEFATVDALAKFVIPLDNHLTAVLIENRQVPSNNTRSNVVNQRGVPPPQGQTQQPNYAPSGFRHFQGPQGSQPLSQTPSQSYQGTPRGGSISLEEKEARMRSGACRYCGEPGHFAKDCAKGQAAWAKKERLIQAQGGVKQENSANLQATIAENLPQYGSHNNAQETSQSIPGNARGPMN